MLAGSGQPHARIWAAAPMLEKSLRRMGPISGRVKVLSYLCAC